MYYLPVYLLSTVHPSISTYLLSTIYLSVYNYIYLYYYLPYHYLYVHTTSGSTSILVCTSEVRPTSTTISTVATSVSTPTHLTQHLYLCARRRPDLPLLLSPLSLPLHPHPHHIWSNTYTCMSEDGPISTAIFTVATFTSTPHLAQHLYLCVRRRSGRSNEDENHRRRRRTGVSSGPPGHCRGSKGQ